MFLCPATRLEGSRHTSRTVLVSIGGRQVHATELIWGLWSDIPTPAQEHAKMMRELDREEALKEQRRKRMEDHYHSILPTRPTSDPSLVARTGSQQGSSLAGTPRQGSNSLFAANHASEQLGRGHRVRPPVGTWVDPIPPWWLSVPTKQPPAPTMRIMRRLSFDSGSAKSNAQHAPPTPQPVTKKREVSMVPSDRSDFGG